MEVGRMSNGQWFINDSSNFILNARSNRCKRVRREETRVDWSLVEQSVQVFRARCSFQMLVMEVLNRMELASWMDECDFYSSCDVISQCGTNMSQCSHMWIHWVTDLSDHWTHGCFTACIVSAVRHKSPNVKRIGQTHGQRANRLITLTTEDVPSVNLSRMVTDGNYLHFNSSFLDNPRLKIIRLTKWKIYL